jgi:hypothetical protein
MPASRVRIYAGEDVWRSYFKFSFERNPWDRQVSWYNYKTKSKASADKPDFDAFNRDRRRAFVENWSLYTAEDRPILDFVGRYETLQTDFDSVLDRIGLAGQVALPRENVSRSRTGSYRDYYSETSRELIAGWYAPEIRHFGYTF